MKTIRDLILFIPGVIIAIILFAIWGYVGLCVVMLGLMSVGFQCLKAKLIRAATRSIK